MTGYVISKDWAPSPLNESVTIFATTDEAAIGNRSPAHWTPIRHHAKAWRERRRAVAVLHANGWHRHGWRVENARRYREAVQ